MKSSSSLGPSRTSKSCPSRSAGQMNVNNSGLVVPPLGGLRPKPPKGGTTNKDDAAMRKSLVVKLVFLNSALAMSACSRTCEEDEKKAKAQPGAVAPASCRGSSH